PAPEPSAPQAGASAPQPGAPAAGAAAGTAAPAGMTPEELKQKLSSVGLVNPLPSLAVGGATYVGGIVLSVLTIVLIAIAAAVASIGNPVEAALETADMDPSEALSGIGSAVRFPFQLVAMAMLGSLGFSKTIEGETSSASVGLPRLPQRPRGGAVQRSRAASAGRDHRRDGAAELLRRPLRAEAPGRRADRHLDLLGADRLRGRPVHGARGADLRSARPRLRGH